MVPPLREDPAHRVKVERNRPVFQNPSPTLDKSDELIFVVKGAFAHDGADDCIQSRAIASAR